MICPRPLNPDMPEWLEDFRLPDDLSQEAYDRFGAYPRSLVKTAIALAQFHFAPSTGSSYLEEDNPSLAFCGQSLSCPARLVFLIFSSAYDAAALASAAAILPQLCAIDYVCALCLSKQPSFSILAPLELCGIEDIFCLDEEKCLKLLKNISLPASANKNINPARALLLDFNGSLSSLAQALGDTLPLLYLDKRPVIHLENPSAWERSLPALLFGSEALLEDNPLLCDAIYINTPPANSRDFLSSCPAPLILTKACAGFWIFPELGPEFFRMRRLAFDLYNPLI